MLNSFKILHEFKHLKTKIMYLTVHEQFSVSDYKVRIRKKKVYSHCKTPMVRDAQQNRARRTQIN